MNRYVLLVIAVILNCCSKEKNETVFTVTPLAPMPVEKSNDMKIYVHYMPWFETRATSANGNWGWHWTMNNQNPDITDDTGKRQIASHYYPLIGPYASSDPALIEYHLLLMKYSGIDGVLIDWYGSSDVLDYGLNRRNTEALISLIDKTGLEFAIVYEDVTVSRVLEAGATSDKLSQARKDMLYLQKNYFNLDSYIEINGKPLLMVFGPNYFSDAPDWENIFSVFTTPPCFLPLWGHSGSTVMVSSGEFIWVDQVNIDTKYASSGNFDIFIGGAWPGFHDFYDEGNVGETLFTIDHRNGDTWSELLEKAQSYQAQYLQLITWNDFGEGTMIEPTEEFGYLFLSELQSFTGVEYSVEDFEYITRQYLLRKSLDKSEQKFLDQAFYYWVSLQNNKAMQLVDSLASSSQFDF